MAVSGIKKLRCVLKMRLCRVLVVYFCTLFASFVTATNDSIINIAMVNDKCSTSFTMSPGDSPRPLLSVTPFNFDPATSTTTANTTATNRTSIIYDVKACSDAEVLLYATALRPVPRASVIHVVLGQNNETISFIEHYGTERAMKIADNPLRCGEFQRFAVTWSERRVRVYKRVNDTWEKFLLYPSTKPMDVVVHSVFVGYKVNYDAEKDESNSSSSSIVDASEWRIYGVPCNDSEDEEVQDGLCHKDDPSSMVSRGHLAGAVIASLLGGVLLGAFCVVLVPRCLKWISGKKQSWGAGAKQDAARDGGAATEEELTTLVTVQTPAKPPGQASSPRPTSPATPQDPHNLDVTLPGDDPVPSTGAGATPKRKPSSNAYTPYHEMGGSGSNSAAVPVATKDDVAGKTKQVQRKASSGSGSGGRAVASPLPPLPGSDAGTDGASATEPADELYVNADAHIYAGMHMDAPIYENRNTGVYEDLNASAKEK